MCRYLSDPEVTMLTSMDVRPHEQVEEMIRWEIEGYKKSSAMRWGETVQMKRGEGQSNRRRTRLLHRIFELGVLAKGIDGGLELIGGLLLLVLSPAAIRGTVLILVQGELKEDPTDLVANLLLHTPPLLFRPEFLRARF
jgi:hypothetical protein